MQAAPGRCSQPMSSESTVSELGGKVCLKLAPAAATLRVEGTTAAGWAMEYAWR